MNCGSQYLKRRDRILDLRLQRVYREAQKDLQKKFEEFTRSKIKKDQKKRKLKDEGKISEKQYKEWLAGQVFIGDLWKQKIKDATYILEHSNEQALHIIRDEQFDVFADSANFEAYKIEKDFDFSTAVSFNLYNEESVQVLLEESPELLPPKRLKGKKDRAWNQGVISNALTQAIIQGESIPKVAERLAHDTANTDMKAMVRYARTAMTAAHSAGQLESMKRAQDMGIRVEKQWIATLDGKTRDSHRHLDGQTVPINRKFKSDLGYINEPGDPEAEPADVYNCRCRMIRVYPDYPEENPDWRKDEIIDGVDYETWKKGKEEEKKKKIGRELEKEAEASKINASGMLDVFTYDSKNGILYGEEILRGIGAKSKAYPILKNPETNEKITFVAGTRPKYPPDHIIAGYGCKTGKKIGDIKRLVTTYNADAERWQKEKARYEIYDEFGEIREIELHWYQHPEVGKVEFKIKIKNGRMYVDEW